MPVLLFVFIVFPAILVVASAIAAGRDDTRSGLK